MRSIDTDDSAAIADATADGEREEGRNAESVASPAGSVRRMRGRDACEGEDAASTGEETTADGGPDDRDRRQPADPTPPSPFDPDLVALTVVPDDGSPTGKSIIGPQDRELEDRSRLAGALLGIGGPIHHLVGPLAMDRIDTDAARGVAFALANGCDDPVVVLMSQMAAATYVVYSRVAGAAGRAAGEQHAFAGRRSMHDLTRSMNTLARGFDRCVQALEMARTRARHRDSIPAFVVARVRRSGETGGER